MKLSTFIESLLILYTKWKSFNFFSVYLLEIYQAQLKNPNYDVLLSAWVVSMEICPKECFISIWHLSVCSNQNSQKYENKAWDHRGVFRNMPHISDEVLCKNT